MAVKLKKAEVAPPAEVVSMAEKIGVVFPKMEMVPLKSVKGHGRNSRDHSEEQLTALVASIQRWGWTIPLVVNEEGTILAGHGRWEAARRASLKEVSVVRVKGWDDFKQRAYMLADNQLALLSYWDWGVLSEEIDFLQSNDFDLDSLGMSQDAKAALSSHKMSLAPAPLPGTTGVPGSMVKRYVVVPFSAINVSEVWWLEEKVVWLSRGVIQADMAVLYDLMLRWFCPLGGGVVGAPEALSMVPDALGYKTKGGDFIFVDGVSIPGEAHQRLVEVAPLLADNRFAAVALRGDAPPSVLFPVLEAARASGLRYYNEIVIDGMGSGEGELLPCRHVLVLGFVKGNEREAASTVGEVNVVEVPRKELDVVPVINDPKALTPIIAVGDVWMKRDDYFAVGTARGGKVRSCLVVSEGASGLVTAGSRASPQVNIVAQVAALLGVPARAHLPQGELSPCVKETASIIELVQHKAGYNNVIVKRARDDAAKSGWREVPFGMETEIAVNCTRSQVRNIPEGVDRIIMPVGSGMSLAGVLWGLLDEGLSLPVFGVSVGADPTERLDKYAPPNWRDMVQLVKSDLDYHDPAPETIFRGVQLDPIYESKVLPFIKPGDLFWVVGIRSVL